MIEQKEALVKCYGNAALSVEKAKFAVKEAVFFT